jgi:protease IV
MRNTLSAILRQEWLIAPDYVSQHLSMIVRMANGEQVDFGLKRDESTEPRALYPGAGFQSAAIYGVSPSTNLSSFQPGTIAQVDIIGPVLKYGDMCTWGSVDFAALITRLAANGNIAGIIINVDSPGGQAAGTQQVADAIKAAGRIKPVVGMIDDGYAASAAMWMISACSEVYVTKKTDQAGSIGVYMTLADWYAMAKSQGLPVRDIYAPQSTDKNGPYREALKGNDGPMKEQLGLMADAFISAIKTNRAGKLTSDEWNTGGMYNAKEAIKIGLVDGMKSYTQIVKRVEQLVQSRQTQNQNNMSAFAKFMAVAAITEIAVVEGGFLVSEETLNAVNAALEGNESAIAGHQAALDGLNATIAERDATIATLQAADHQATIATLQQRIAEKDAKIAELSGKPASTFTAVTKTGSDHKGNAAGANKFRTSADEQMEKIMSLRGETDQAA